MEILVADDHSWVSWVLVDGKVWCADVRVHGSRVDSSEVARALVMDSHGMVCCCLQLLLLQYQLPVDLWVRCNAPTLSAAVCVYGDSG
jgi:hypothetical protein